MTIHLADTSVWIDALRQRDSWVKRNIAADAPIAYTEPVLMELLSGVRSDRDHENTVRWLSRGPLLRFDAAADFIAAASVYRTARRAGVTPNSHTDCMIIAVASRRSATLVTSDKQQARIARMFGVAVLA